MTGDDLQDAISRNVRILMAIRGMTQQAVLSSGLGVTQAELSRKLNNKRRWHLDDIPALASALGVRPADLLREPAELVAAAVDTPAGAVDHADIRADKGLNLDVYHKIYPLPRDASALVKARERWGLAADQAISCRPTG